MKRTMFQKATCLILSVTLILGALSITSLAATEKVPLKTNGTAATLEEMKQLVGTLSYDDYIADYKGVNKDKGPYTIDIDLINNSVASGAIVVGESNVCFPDDWSNFYIDTDESGAITKSEKDEALYLPATTVDGDGKIQAGVASWTFTVPNGEEGLYYLYIDYYNCKTSDSSVSAIQRKLKIDGKVPFKEVSSISFDKTWSYNYVSTTDPAPTNDKRGEGTFVKYDEEHTWTEVVNGETVKKTGYCKIVTKNYYEGDVLMQTVTTYRISSDIVGNSMAPEAIETSKWSTYICRDQSGYHDGYFAFYLPYGVHTITLEAEREPVVIKGIRFERATDLASSAEYDDASGTLTYDEYLELHKDKADASSGKIRIEAEFPDAVSDSSVIPSNMNDSSANYPISSKAQMYNSIGETSYKSVGQWAAYKFTVNESGMYKLGMRYKQDALQGMFICRTIKLAGGDYGYMNADGTVTATVPFAEAQNARFGYSDSWQSNYVGYYAYYDKDGNVLDVVGKNSDGKYVDSDGNVVENVKKQAKRDFEFYFEEGVEYTIYFECSLGDLREYIRQVETSLEKVNDCYLRILQRTGTSPDENQDYNFYETMPDVLVTLLEEAVNLTRIADELEALCGTNGAHLATLDNVARVLDTMGKDHGENIAENMGTLKTNLGTLGTWVNDSKQGVLVVDSIYIVPAASAGKAALPREKSNFFQSLWFEISSFIHSFFTKYDQMGLTKEPDENTETVEVWLASGRDQSQIWRNMIDSEGGFTNTSGHAVSLKLVTAGTLLPSILAGRGPDVYMGIAAADVMNFAIREALVSVNGKDDSMTDKQNAIFTTNVYKDASGKLYYFADKDIAQRDMEKEGYTLVSNSFDATMVNPKTGEENFSPAAINALELLEQVYGVPDTMSFAMMFYRMDILAELNKEVPETWEELIAMLPDLQTNNMTIGVSYISALDFMMYQRGGNMWKYTNDTNGGGDDTYYPYAEWEGSQIDLDSDIALEAFDYVCRLYTEHSLPVSYDASNRFRTGELPIVIDAYVSIYNTLVIFATEIGGLWEFSSLPGSEYEDAQGNKHFNYDSLAGVTATVITCDKNRTTEEYQAAWEFIQWQTGAEAQAEYGNKIVALIGPAAKYGTANVHAIEDLSWTAKEKAAIRDQMANLNSVVNYPGSYIYSRYMKFAFLDVYNDGAVPYEAMLSYIPAINAEIARKREEFGMPTATSKEEALTEPPVRLVK